MTLSEKHREQRILFLEHLFGTFVKLGSGNGIERHTLLGGTPAHDGIRHHGVGTANDRGRQTFKTD